VVLAGPLHLDRRADALRDRGRLDDAVVREPAPEAAAAAKLMQRDVALRNAEELGDRLDRRLRRLRRRPDLGPALRLAPAGAVLRLEIRVRDVRIRVERLDRAVRAREGGIDVAAIAQRRLRRGLREPASLGDGLGPAVPRGVGLVPFDPKLALRLER